MLKFDATENAKARVFFQRAIAPEFAPAYSALALTCHYEGSRFAGRPLREANEEAQLWALKAVEADPGDADAQIMLANVTHLMGDREAARERASRALASPQVSAWSIGTAAGIWLSDGQSAEARDLFFNAMRLSPRDPLMPGFLRLIAMSYYFEGDFRLALEISRQLWASTASALEQEPRRTTADPGAAPRPLYTNEWSSAPLHRLFGRVESGRTIQRYCRSRFRNASGTRKPPWHLGASY